MKTVTFILGFFTSMLQSLALQGTVVDSLYQQGLDSVKVTVKGTSVQTWTDPDGRFSIDLATSMTGKLAVKPCIYWESGRRTFHRRLSNAPLTAMVMNCRGEAILKVHPDQTAPNRTRRLPPLKNGIYFIRTHDKYGVRFFRLMATGLSEKYSTVVPIGVGTGSPRSAGLAKVPAQQEFTLVLERKNFRTREVSLIDDNSNHELVLVRYKTPVLILAGIGVHDWERIHGMLKAILMNSGLFHVDVSLCPPSYAADGWDQWRPDFSKYMAVIVVDFMTFQENKNTHHWPDAVKTEFVEFVSSGGGFYSFHGSYDSFNYWPEYLAMIGMGGQRNSSFGYTVDIGTNGELIRIPPDQDPPNAGHHDRFDRLVFKLTDHPITRGLPDSWMTPLMEVYYGMRGPAENMTVLSYGEEERYGNLKPVEWTVDYGSGHVYVNTNAHLMSGTEQCMRDVWFQTALIRACEWLGVGEVIYPVPENFPTETEVSLNPESSLILTY